MRLIHGIPRSAAIAAALLAVSRARPSRAQAGRGRVDGRARRTATARRRTSAATTSTASGSRPAGATASRSIPRLSTPVDPALPAGETEPVAENDDRRRRPQLAHHLHARRRAATMCCGCSPSPPRAAAPIPPRPRSLPPLPPPVAEPATANRGATHWQIWDGELAESDPDRDGNHFDDYLVRCRRRRDAADLARSAGFDAIVWVLRADRARGRAARHRRRCRRRRSTPCSASSPRRRRLYRPGHRLRPATTGRLPAVGQRALMPLLGRRAGSRARRVPKRLLRRHRRRTSARPEPVDQARDRGRCAPSTRHSRDRPDRRERCRSSVRARQ